MAIVLALSTPSCLPGKDDDTMMKLLLLAGGGKTQRYLYVTNPVGETVSMFSIDGETGMLSPLSPGTVAAGTWPNGIGLHPGNGFLYASGNGAVYMFSIDPATGSLVSLDPPSLAGSGLLNDMAMSPDRHYAYVLNTTQSKISTFGVNGSTGQLSLLSSITIPGNSSMRFALHHTGSFLYLPGHPLNVIHMLRINKTTGEISTLTPSTITLGTDPVYVAIHPDGEFLYALADNTIYMLSVNASTGQLSLLSPSTISTASAVTTLCVHPSGRYAYAVSNNALFLFRVNESTGQLSAQSPPSIAVGPSPFHHMAIHPGGTYLYLSSLDEDLVYQYGIDQSTGQLSPLSTPSVPGGNGPDRIVIR